MRLAHPEDERAMNDCGVPRLKKTGQPHFLCIDFAMRGASSQCAISEMQTSATSSGGSKQIFCLNALR
jgi:hypothetical protein